MARHLVLKVDVDLDEVAERHIPNMLRALARMVEDPDVVVCGDTSRSLVCHEKWRGMGHQEGTIRVGDHTGKVVGSWVSDRPLPPVGKEPCPKCGSYNNHKCKTAECIHCDATGCNHMWLPGKPDAR